MTKIIVENTEINVANFNNLDYMPHRYGWSEGK